MDSFADAVLNLEFSGLGDNMSITIDAWVATEDDLDDLEPNLFVLNGVAVTDDAEAVDSPTTPMIDETVVNDITNDQLALRGGADSNDVLSQRLTATDNEAQVIMGLGTAFFFASAEERRRR